MNKSIKDIIIIVFINIIINERMWRGEIDEKINCFNINDDWINNKEIKKYLRKYFNGGKPILTKKRLENCFYFFKEDCINSAISDELYNLILNIKNVI